MARPPTHGLSQTHLYRIWQSIRQRCRSDPDYAGRVSVCDEWERDVRAFVAWAEVSGYSRELSIDRINPQRGYSPDNCRWIPLRQNIRRRSGVRLTPELVREIRAQIGTVKQRHLAAKYGVSKYAIYAIQEGKAWADVK